MSTKLKLVKDDTGPPIVASLTDKVTGLPINITGALALKLYFRAVGSTTIKDTLTGTPLTGKVKADNVSIDYNAPYNVAGAGGRLSFPLNATTLDTAGEFEGEIEVTFADATRQTVFDLYKFTVRADF